MTRKRSSKKAPMKESVGVTIRFKNRKRLEYLRSAATELEISFNKFVEKSAIAAADRHFAAKAADRTYSAITANIEG